MTDTVAHVAELRRAAEAAVDRALEIADALAKSRAALARLEAENERLREAAAIALDARDEVLASISPTLFAAMEPLRDALLHGASDD